MNSKQEQVDQFNMERIWMDIGIIFISVIQN